MKKIVRFLILLTIVSLSCNFLTGEPAFVEVKGPILGMRTAAALDDQGELVDPAYSFAPTASQISVVVQVGALEGPAPLSVIWYRVNDQGDEKLFEHTIQVDTFDLGYSIGLNPDLLASGTYKAVAALGDWTQTLTWIVAQEQAQPGVENNASSAPSQQGSLPVSGASGKTPPSQRVSGGTPPAGATLPAGCKSDLMIWDFPPVVGGGASIRGEAVANDITPCASLGELEVMVWIGNNSPTSACIFTVASGLCTFTGNPCLLNGGSDLPLITKVNADLREKQTGKVFAQETLVLSADTTGPVVTIEPITDPAKKVNAGDKIELTVTAEEVRGAWQTGVQEIQMTGPVYAPDGSWTNPSRAAKACTEKTWNHTQTFTYEVPPNQTEIKLCVLAKDYADNYNKRDDCITYHTGDQLKGTLNQNLHQEGPSAEGRYNLVWQLDTDLSLTLEPGGALSGTAQMDYSMDNAHFQSESCGMVREWVDPTQITLAVTGTWTEDVIDFHYTADAPIMVTKNFEIIPDCGGSGTEQLELSYLVGLYYHAAWDGQAYTADETTDCSGTDSTCTTILKIHLEPPAPGVGFSPGLWAAASADQASVDLTYP